MPIIKYTVLLILSGIQVYFYTSVCYTGLSYLPSHQMAHGNRLQPHLAEPVEDILKKTEP